MRIMNAGYEIMPMNGTMFENIEKVARICYKSEDKICEGSAERMVRSLVKRNHEAMLEHESIIFAVDFETYKRFTSYVKTLESLGFDNMMRTTYFDRGIISGNIRMWRDLIRFSLPIMKDYDDTSNYRFPQVLADLMAYKSKWPIIFDDMDMEAADIFDGCVFTPIDKEQLTDEEKPHHYTITVVFSVDAGVGREITRHRKSSFAQESTRYVNYSKGQYGSEIAVIKPCFFEEGSDAYTAWKKGCRDAEAAYMQLIEMGRTPQEARDVLPFSVKSELVMTTVIKYWQHFFDLRAREVTGGAHPQMKEVAVPLYHEMKRDYPGLFE